MFPFVQKCLKNREKDYICAMREKLFCLLLLIGTACTRTGPLPVPEDGSVVISNRISNRRVNGFTQDGDGHIWIATGRGLDKYTGSEFFQYFCADDTLGLPANQLNAVHCARDGSLWAATMNGVAVRTDRGDFRRVPVLGRNANIVQILETNDGRLLFSNGSSLFQYDGQEDVLRPVIREFNAFGSPSAQLQSDGLLWAITGGGHTLDCYSLRDFSLVRSQPLPSQTYHICAFADGELWLSGMGQLHIFDTRSADWKELPAAIRSERRIMEGDVDILFAPDGKSLLLNVIGTGFFLYSRARETVTFQEDADFPYDVPETTVQTLFRDRSGNLWFGTADRGIHVSYQEHGLFGGNKYLTEAMRDRNVISLATDRDGGLWMATFQDGLFRYGLDSRQLEKIPVEHLIPDDKVGYVRTSRLYCDSDGDLWLVFTEKMRVIRCRWDGRKLVSKDVIYFNTPLSILEDERGAIWIGGMSGTLTRYDKSDGSRQEVDICGPGDWTFVPDLLRKEPGKILAACFNREPAVVNTYSLQAEKEHFDPANMTGHIRRSVLVPSCLYKDSAGDIWLGTYANGLILRDGKTDMHQLVEGTPCLDIASVVEDRQGNVWISTQAGLGRYDRTTGGIVHYLEDDGTGGDQFNDRASCILPDGTLVFGGTHGITWFNPLDAPGKRTVPLVFESLTIHNQMVRPGPGSPIPVELSRKPEVVIGAWQNGFGISYQALDYSNFEQIRYAYKLEGFDTDWVKTGTRHDAYFANLPAGTYTLQVRISDASHSITETVESLTIRVLPPWQRSWWAVCLWVLLGGLVLATLYLLWRRIRRVRHLAALHIREARREREQAEAARQAEKELNRIQMNYFSNVAHEFRTPLTMIVGPAQQLTASGNLQGQDRQLADLIRRNAVWMLSLVNQLLDFNRIGNRKLQMKVTKTDIVEPLRGIADLFRFNARSKDIDFKTYGLEDAFTLWVDVDKMQKITMNLLSNAMKFTPRGGKVTLSFDVIPREEAAARFPLTDADSDGQYACISVADSGSGIREDELEKIFERFYQSENRSDTHGSGIGLFYAKVLCSLHHGHIRAWNREEGGALFSFILPVSASSYPEEERTSETPQLMIPVVAPVPAAEPEETPEGDRRRIIVVDDDIDIANYLKMILAPQYKVSLYFDAASALKGLAEEAADLVISDVVMPGMSGYALCEKIKKNLELSHIPVVLVTAKVAVENQVQGLDMGADAYVTKPFQPAYLLALVKSLMENREKLRRQLGSVTTTEEIAQEALSPRDAAFMKELYALMEKELANADLDITRITEIMKISRTKFYYKVKGLTGENPSVFFKRYRLNRAADLLKEGRYNMSEIAWMTGFNTLSHFSTSFKKQFGVPPSDYPG